MTAETGELLERRSLHRGRGGFLDLRLDRVRLPNGRVAELEVVAHPGAAAIVPLTASGEVILLRQYRHATGRWLLEVPAGKLSPGEPPELCAARELEEETGWRARRLDELGRIWATPGFCDERLWLYLARDLEPGRQDLEPEEILELVVLPWAEAIDYVTDGRIEDAKSVSALLLADRVLS